MNNYELAISCFEKDEIRNRDMNASKNRLNKN
jgi:hypothetical protein